MLSALVITVPRAAPLVEGWLERTAGMKPSQGVPAHVTVLFPFVPAERIDEALLEELRALFAGFEPFGFTLPRLARFPTTLYLDPEPAGPFRALTQAVAERWPEHQPYEGAFDEVVPHLTAAQGEPDLLDLAEAEIAPKLPLVGRASEVTLLVEAERFGELWERHATFPFGSDGRGDG
jgi:2'-5' RNA ligase